MNAEQAAIRQAAKDFVTANIIPHAAEYDRTGEFHSYLLQAAKPSGIFGMAVPKEYGGLGYGPLTQALVLEEWATDVRRWERHFRPASSAWRPS